MTKHPPFRYFKTSPEVSRLAVMMYVRFPLSHHNVEELVHELGDYQPRTNSITNPISIHVSILS